MSRPFLELRGKHETSEGSTEGWYTRQPALPTVWRRVERNIVGYSSGRKECNDTESQERRAGVTDPEFGNQT